MRSTDRSPWRGEIERDLAENYDVVNGVISVRGFVTINYREPDSDLVWSVSYSKKSDGTYLIRGVQVKEAARKTIVPDLHPEAELRLRNFLVPYDMSGETRVSGTRVYVANCAKTPLLTLTAGSAVLELKQPTPAKDVSEIAQVVEDLLLAFSWEREKPREVPVPQDPGKRLDENIARAAEEYKRRREDRPAYADRLNL